MDWSGISGAVILGVLGLLSISLLFWGGHALLDLMGKDIIVTRAAQPGPSNAPPERKPLADGEERLATKEERDDINVIARRPGRLAVDQLGKRRS